MDLVLYDTIVKNKKKNWCCVKYIYIKCILESFLESLEKVKKQPLKSMCACLIFGVCMKVECVKCACMMPDQSGQSALRGAYTRLVGRGMWAYFASGSEGDKGKGFSSVGKNVPLCSNYRCSQWVRQPQTPFGRWRENGGGLGETVWGKESVFILSRVSWELCLWAGTHRGRPVPQKRLQCSASVCVGTDKEREKKW